MEVDEEVTIKDEITTNEKTSALDLFCKKKNEFKNSLARCVQQIEYLLANDGNTREIEIRKNRLEEKLEKIKNERDTLHGE